MDNQIVPYENVEKMAIAIAKSGLFGVKTPEQAIALMLVAQAEGLHPATAARDYDIIQGRPAKKSEAMLRSFLSCGGRVEWIQLDDKCAKAKFSHSQGGEVTIEWDMARVAKAQIANAAMYQKYPRQMLRSRCVSEGIRTVYPMATSGMYDPEEVRDEVPIKQAEVVDADAPKLSMSRLEGIVLGSEKAADPEKKPAEVAVESAPAKPTESAAPLAVAAPVKQPEPGPVTAPAPDEIPAKATGVVIGKIEQMQSKKGFKKDKVTPWTKWAVLVEGAWFGTFSESVANKLLAAKTKNAPIQIYFSTRVDGEKKFNDIEAVMEMAPAAVPSATNDQEDTVI